MKETLASLLRERINSVYGGNQAAFSRATGFTTQTINTWLSGKVTLPQLDARRRLAKELGISHLDLLIAAGELDRSEVQAAGVQGATEPTWDRIPSAVQDLLADIDWSRPDAVSFVAPTLTMLRGYQKGVPAQIHDPNEVERKPRKE